MRLLTVAPYTMSDAEKTLQTIRLNAGSVCSINPTHLIKASDESGAKYAVTTVATIGYQYLIVLQPFSRHVYGARPIVEQ